MEVTSGSVDRKKNMIQNVDTYHDTLVEETGDLAFAEEIRDLGFVPFTIKMVELLPPGTMNSQQRAVYDVVYNAKTLEEIATLKITSNLSPYALDGAVASADFDKFEFVLRHFRFNYDYGDHVIGHVISIASLNKIDEEVVKKMIYLLIEKQASLSKHSVSMAAGNGYYQIAEYFLTQTTEKILLNGYDLYDIVDGANRFDSFKWLLDHGYRVEKSMLAKIICHESVEGNFRKYPHLKEKNNIMQTVEFLIEIGVTTESKVAELQSNCHLAAEVINSVKVESSDVLSKYILNGASLSTIKFLLEQGADTDYVIYNTVAFTSLEMIKLLIEHGASVGNGGKLGYRLMNHHDADLVRYVINEMAAREIKIVADNENDYLRIIPRQMSRNMENCEVNRIIADYAEISGQINWSECDNI